MRKVNPLRVLMLGLIALAGFSAGPAWAKNCGDTTGLGHSDVPCECGDTVTTSTILRASDPVVRTVCPRIALSVLPGVTLNMSSAIIRCADPRTTIGISIVEGEATIVGGIIEGCGVGVSSVSEANGSLIQGVTARNGGRGFLIVGSDNELIRNRCDRNATEGIAVVGEGNILEDNYCLGNGGTGIAAVGANALHRNQGRNNGGQGVLARPSVPGEDPSTDGRNYGIGNGVRPDCEIKPFGSTTPNGRYC